MVNTLPLHKKGDKEYTRTVVLSPYCALHQMFENAASYTTIFDCVMQLKRAISIAFQERFSSTVTPRVLLENLLDWTIKGFWSGWVLSFCLAPIS